MKKLLTLGILSALLLVGCSQTKEEQKAKQSVSSENITIKSKRNTDIYATMVAQKA